MKLSSLQNSLLVVSAVGLIISNQIEYFLFFTGIFLIAYLVTLKTLDLLSTKEKKINFYLSIVIALLFVTDTPILSDDLFRYIWEGHAINLGMNPYQLSPSNFDKNPLAQRVGHGNFTAVYPPISIYFFSLATKISTSYIALKGAFFIFYLLLTYEIAKFFQKKNSDFYSCIIFTLNPLILLEVCHSGHFDIIPIYFIVFCLLRIDISTLKLNNYLKFIFGLAISFKWNYAYFLPAILKNEKLTFKNIIIFCILISSSSVLSLIMYYCLIGNITATSLLKYLATWEFNSLIFSILSLVFSFKISKITLLIAQVCFIILFLRFTKNKSHSSLGYLWFGLIALSPVCYPWYFLLSLVLFIIAKNYYLITAHLFLLFSYEVLIGFYNIGEWNQNWGLMTLEWLLIIGFLILDYSRQKTKTSLLG